MGTGQPLQKKVTCRVLSVSRVCVGMNGKRTESGQKNVRDVAANGSSESLFRRQLVYLGGK